MRPLYFTQCMRTVHCVGAVSAELFFKNRQTRRDQHLFRQTVMLNRKCRYISRVWSKNMAVVRSNNPASEAWSEVVWFFLYNHGNIRHVRYSVYPKKGTVAYDISRQGIHLILLSGGEGGFLNPLRPKAVRWVLLISRSASGCTGAAICNASREILVST